MTRQCPLCKRFMCNSKVDSHTYCDLCRISFNGFSCSQNGPQCDICSLWSPQQWDLFNKPRRKSSNKPKSSTKSNSTSSSTDKMDPNLQGLVSSVNSLQAMFGQVQAQIQQALPDAGAGRGRGSPAVYYQHPPPLPGLGQGQSPLGYTGGRGAVQRHVGVANTYYQTLQPNPPQVGGFRTPLPTWQGGIGFQTPASGYNTMSTATPL